MPCVNVQITKGVTREQKSRLVRRITDALVQELGTQSDHIHVVIQEIDDENGGSAETRAAEWKRQQQSGQQ